MSIIQQEGTLICDKVGHNQELINFICINTQCNAPVRCCTYCLMKDHQNHKQEDFQKITEIREQINSHLSYLDQLLEASYSLCQFCQQWNKEIHTVIQKIKENLQMSELSDSVKRITDSKISEQIKTFINHFNNKSYEVSSILKQLTTQTNNLLQDKFKIQDKFNQQSFIKGKILNLDNIKFTLTQQLQGHDGEVGFVAISNDDKYFASSSQDPGKVILWDVKSHQQIAQYETENRFISALQFSNDNSMLAVSSDQWVECDRIIEIFDLTTLNNSQDKIKLEGHSSRITRITFTDDSKYLISVSWGQLLRVWDLNEKKEINKQECDGELLGVAYSHQQKLIACCDWNGLCYLFDSKNLNNLQLIVKWQAHSYESYCIEFIRNSTIIMTSKDQETRFWQIEDLLNKKFNHFKEIKIGGWTVKAYPIDNPQVIINCSSDDIYFYLWSYDSTELIQRLETPDKLFEQSFAITSDFKKIITGGCNKKVNIFEQEDNN